MKSCIIYSSVTGNTRKVAEALAAASGAPCFPVREAPDPDDYDLLALGFWVRLGQADARTQGYMLSLIHISRGLSIQIDDLSLGDHPPAGEEPMYVRIKQGLAQTVNSFFKDELNFTAVNITSNMTQSEIDDAIALKSKNGALMSLRDNYKSIMENIDKKIEREQYRLETWEARQKAVFANLETLLKNYSEQEKTLKAQLKQLSSGSD